MHADKVHCMTYVTCVVFKLTLRIIFCTYFIYSYSDITWFSSSYLACSSGDNGSCYSDKTSMDTTSPQLKKLNKSKTGPEIKLDFLSTLNLVLL